MSGGVRDTPTGELDDVYLRQLFPCVCAVVTGHLPTGSLVTTPSRIAMRHGATLKVIVDRFRFVAPPAEGNSMLLCGG